MCGCKEKQLLKTTDMRMLRWTVGVTLKYKIRSEEIRQKTGTANIMVTTRVVLPCLQEKEDNILNNILDAPDNGKRKHGRQKK
jgi:hypothetical protein